MRYFQFETMLILKKKKKKITHYANKNTVCISMHNKMFSNELY